LMRPTKATGEPCTHPPTEFREPVQQVLAHGEQDGLRSMVALLQHVSRARGNLVHP
jgi:hypothetical protein